MNSFIIKSVLPFCELWDMDLYIWDNSKLYKIFKKGTYSVSFNYPLISIKSYQDNLTNDNIFYIHYLCVKSIKIKFRINIVINKSGI